MGIFTDQQLREVFHLLFLENLLRVSGSGQFVLKGGVNLRFFFKSPRYSEDMDLDVTGVSVPTLKKNCYKILASPAFRRSLSVYGIKDLIINDPEKAKQTTTTQRFRLRLVNTKGEIFPTKVEFSRRSGSDQFIDEDINPSVSGPYSRLSYRCLHYTGNFAVVQKIKALAGRTEVQARDVFDLYILFLGNNFEKKNWNLSDEVLVKAQESALSISYEQYRDQVEMYLNPDGLNSYGGRENWDKIQNLILDQIK
jgi:hypothetical protein